MHTGIFVFWIRVVTIFIYSFFFDIIVWAGSWIIFLLLVFEDHVYSWAEFDIFLFYLVHKCAYVIQTWLSPSIFGTDWFVVHFLVVLMTDAKRKAKFFFYIFIKFRFQLIRTRLWRFTMYLLQRWFFTDAKTCDVFIILAGKRRFQIIKGLAISNFKKKTKIKKKQKYTYIGLLGYFLPSLEKLYICLLVLLLSLTGWTY